MSSKNALQIASLKAQAPCEPKLCHEHNYRPDGYPNPPFQHPKAGLFWGSLRRAAKRFVVPARGLDDCASRNERCVEDVVSRQSLLLSAQGFAEIFRSRQTKEAGTRSRIHLRHTAGAWVDAEGKPGHETVGRLTLPITAGNDANHASGGVRVGHRARCASGRLDQLVGVPRRIPGDGLTESALA